MTGDSGSLLLKFLYFSGITVFNAWYCNTLGVIPLDTTRLIYCVCVRVMILVLRPFPWFAT